VNQVPAPAEPRRLPAADPPELSVIVAARDEEALITRMLDSVAAQTLPLDRIEVVVAANACTDDTVPRVWSWAAAHPAARVTVIELPEPGIASSRNAAVEVATGRLLAFVDADSRMKRNLAAEIVRFASEGIGAGTIRVDADSRDTLDRAFFRMLDLGRRNGSKGMMFFCTRADFLALGGFDESLRHASDLVMQQRLDEAGVPFAYLGTSAILTSPRRLRTKPFRLGMFTMFGRWTLGRMGIGRRWRYDRRDEAN
jgi:glycosyltransferase involved in cell wall biosynthesis